MSVINKVILMYIASERILLALLTPQGEPSGMQPIVVVLRTNHLHYPDPHLEVSKYSNTVRKTYFIINNTHTITNTHTGQCGKLITIVHSIHNKNRTLIQERKIIVIKSNFCSQNMKQINVYRN